QTGNHLLPGHGHARIGGIERSTIVAVVVVHHHVRAGGERHGQGQSDEKQQQQQRRDQRDSTLTLAAPGGNAPKMTQIAFHVLPSLFFVKEVGGIIDNEVLLNPVPAAVKCFRLVVQIRCCPPDEGNLERANLCKTHLDRRVVWRADLFSRRKE